MVQSHRTMLRLFLIILVACAARSGMLLRSSAQSVSQKESATPPTREAGLVAWQQVYSVLTHPRCINCHTATNYPQTG
jgi:mono/diheme cytochrome c family protein